MVVLTRADLFGTAGQGNRGIPSHEVSRNIPSHPPLSTVVDIRREIWNAVHKADRAITRAEIAKLVDRRKSTWLNTVIESLVADGYLCRQQGNWKNGVVMFWYEVNHE